MPTVSVKLGDDTKLRLNRLAARQGETPHAVMVGAIESALLNAEEQSAFVAAALRSRNRVVASGMVIDGAAFGTYLKARARGLVADAPAPVRIDALLNRAE
jgi:predicted transcriptional regulator